MLRVLASVALVGQVASAPSSCGKLDDCGSCASHAALGLHGCYWCQIDERCHPVGAVADSPCSPPGADDACISESRFSGCRQRSVTACRADQPLRARQVHLSLAGPRAVRVAWKTRGGLPTRVEVFFSTNMTRELGASVAAERSIQYLQGYGYHHVARLAGLAPGAVYQYRIVCDGVTTAFRTFKTAGDDLEATLLVIGDMGMGKNGNAMASRSRVEALKASADMVLHVGDIGYADDSFLHAPCLVEFCYESVYDGYMEWLENLTDSKPYMVAVGNHESECHSPACQVSPHIKRSLSNFSAYSARWAMPSPESGGVANMWYSFDFGAAHFVAVNTETDFPGAPEENFGDGGSRWGSPAGHFAPEGAYLKWLEADLAAASRNRARRPWIVALGHRPWLMKEGSRRDEAVRRAHAPLFQKYGVDLYLTGHVHSYHRLFPLGGNAAVPTIVTGGAGCDEFLSDRERTGFFDVRGNNSLWDFRYYNADYQIGMLKVSPEELSFMAIASTSGHQVDSVSLRAGGARAMYV